MGHHKVDQTLDPAKLRQFEKSLLTDLRALERMLELDLFEKNVSRIGAEQELFLVDGLGRPNPIAMKLLDLLDDPHFTTELAAFNLEFNIDPIRFDGDCLSQLERQLRHFLKKANQAAADLEAHAVCIGILPTLSKSHLTLKNMTPQPRYRALNEAISRLRGAKYELFFRGIDELYLQHDSVMMEAANTSFQVHFQVNPESFAKYYNIAQVVAAPVLAASVNSPIFLARRLWHETRIALFQQSTDTRTHPSDLRKAKARVSFGSDWVQESVLEIYKEDIARFRVLMAMELDEDPFARLEAGEIPKLQALQLHNSTVYHWNRACYGITEGRPHLRIENRILPSGPSPVDEVANAAFWFGLLKGVATEFADVRNLIKFDQVRANFVAAARRGLDAQLHWFNDETLPAQELICNELLPLARTGLERANINPNDIDHYLGVLEERVRSGQTGAAWLVESWDKIRYDGSQPACLSSLVLAAYENQRKNKPVHQWPAAAMRKKSDWRQHFVTVEYLMSTDIFTVNEEDSLELVISLMEWRNIRHVPVEDNRHKLVGFVSYRTLIRLIRDVKENPDGLQRPVSEIMQRNVPTVSPNTTTLEAIAKIRKTGFSALPVVHDGTLVGIITEYDFMKLAEVFLEYGKRESTARQRRAGRRK